MLSLRAADIQPWGAGVVEDLRELSVYWCVCHAMARVFLFCFVLVFLVFVVVVLVHYWGLNL